MTRTRPWRFLAGLGPGVLLMGLLACYGAEPGPSPYGFTTAPEQRFRLETEEETQVDGEPVVVQRYADFRLVAESPAQVAARAGSA